MLPDALALATLAAERLMGTSWEICGDAQTWEMKPRDNQLACAAVLARGDVAELDTGEGKTLCAAIAAACWALVGRVHVVTANDYLARRDYEWMGPLLEQLGLSVGSVQNETPQEERQAAYQSDVTYVSVKEVGADYLRDTLTSERQALHLPALQTAILDEVDFILVDEARIPLILAEQVEAQENLCHQFNEAVAGLVAEQEQIKERIHREIDDIPNLADWSDRKRKFETTVRLAKLLLADPLDPRLDRRFAFVHEQTVMVVLILDDVHPVVDWLKHLRGFGLLPESPQRHVEPVGCSHGFVWELRDPHARSIGFTGLLESTCEVMGEPQVVPDVEV